VSVGAGALVAPRVGPVRSAREVTLIDLLDRLLQGGVVIKGDITLAVADIDLVKIGLQLLVASVDSLGEGQ